MKTFFKKFEFSGIAPLRFLGLFRVSNNNVRQADNNLIIEDKDFTIKLPQGYFDRFPIYDHFKLNYKLLKNHNDHLYLGISFEDNEVIK